MLHVTQDAREICSATVRQLSTQPNTKCLRLIKGDHGVAISFELPRSNDALVRHRGVAILAVPERVANEFSDLSLDVSDDGRFVLS